ncbi:MAG: aminopeptidase [Peptoniphilaceae bacterium]
MLFEDNLKKYSDLIIKQGLRIKKGDVLVIRGNVINHKFINLLAETAFKEGAKDVKVNYKNEEFSKIRLEHASKDVLSDIPKYFIDEQNFYMDKKAKFLTITGNDPNSLKDIDPDKIKTAILANSKALKSFSEKMMNSETSWCVVGAPIPSWAKTVFPDLEENEAMDKLWELIFKTSRADQEDPIYAWNEHVNSLKKYSNFLNSNNFEYLELKNDKGTDLKVKLPENYIFCGASEFNRQGEEFIANIPTEEIFSMPHKDGVNGIVYNTNPFNYNGNLIDNFYLKFEDGLVVEYDAEKGYESLKSLLETDKGSKRLGEIALVPFHSPISQTNILFYNTLYDENASCHLALGKAYPSCIKNGENMTPAELLNNGVNDSLVHEDFMIGDETTSIIGITKDGNRIEIFKNGDFAIK